MASCCTALASASAMFEAARKGRDFGYRQIVVRDGKGGRMCDDATAAWPSRCASSGA